MKNFIFLVFTTLFLFACTKDITENATTGSIAGSVSDNTTGEPVPVVNIVLQPGGKATVTGTNGSFSFTDLIPGEYTISISKEGYTNNTSTLTVEAGIPTQAHLLIERIPAVITVDREILDFGENPGVTSLSFNIVNSSYQDLIWYADHSSKWITELRPSKGTLPFGKTETITVIIDRDKLNGGENETVVVVKSSNGSSQVIIKATGDIKNLAKLNMLSVNNIGQDEATFEAEITAPGEPAYTERGFVYHTSPAPTLDRTIAKLTSPVTTNNLFSSKATRLISGETYFVRAYAINTSGTAYSSNEIEFTVSAQQSQVSTQTIENIDIATGEATFVGSVTSEGIPPYTERGFVYSTHSNPTIENNKIIENGTGTGTYKALATGLSPNTTYYVKAYVIQNGKTFYGNSINFSTTSTATALNTSAVNNIGVTSATFNAIITEEGNPPYSEKGFCYRAGYTPTISNNKIAVQGNGTGNYSIDVNGLEYNTTYYVRAYAIQNGEVIYGNAVNFTTAWTDTKVSTSAATDIEATSARLNGRIELVGNPAYTIRGFCYSTYGTPSTSDMKISEYSSLTGNFSKKINNLREGTNYYVRAYAIQNDETIYGNTITFSTVEMPVVRTDAISNFTSNGNEFFPLYSVQFNGTILSTGNPAYSERGFVYDTYTNPTVGSGTKIRVSGSGTGKYSTTVTDLMGMQYYYVRAYARTESGYVYGETVSFNTYNW